MTDSNVIHSTTTKPSQATSVSSLDLSGSNKNEMGHTFKDGKLRKNAKNKIELLLSMATKIEYKTQSMGMDDCWNANEPQIVDEDFFWTWYEKEYSELTIYVSVRDGQLMYVRFSDCPYHFSNDVVLTFDNIESHDEAETQESAPLTTVDDLGEFDRTLTIKKIVVDWSESHEFKDGETLTLEEYEEKALRAAIEYGNELGYIKTKLFITLDTGEVLGERHDINLRCPSLAVYFASYANAHIRFESKPSVTFEQVTEALEQGYISPLNHDQQRPDPTSPTDETKSNACYESAHELGHGLPFGQPTPTSSSDVEPKAASKDDMCIYVYDDEGIFDTALSSEFESAQEAALSMIDAVMDWTRDDAPGLYEDEDIQAHLSELKKLKLDVKGHEVNVTEPNWFESLLGFTFSQYTFMTTDKE